MKTKMRVTSAAALLLLSMGLSACSEKIPPEEAVKQRALARWGIRVAGKIDGLYEFLSPSKRQTVSRSTYERQFGETVEYSDAEVRQVNCIKEGNEKTTVCQVVLGITVRLKTGNYPSTTNQITETWVLEDGQWWFSPAK